MRDTPVSALTLLAAFLLPLVSALGSVVTVAGLAAARPLAIALIVLALVTVTRWNLAAALVLTAATVWLGWGFLSLSTASNLRNLVALACGLATALAFALIPWTRERLRLLVWGWLFAWVIAVVPGIFETLTGSHLPNYLETSPDYVRESVTDTASFFVNPNPYAVFLCISMVVFAVGARLEKGWLAKALFVASLAGPVLIFPTNSRITQLVSLGIAVWVVLWLEVARPYRARVAAGIVVAGSLAVSFVMLMPQVQERIVVAFQGSGIMRINLYLDALWMFASTGGLGVGPGMFERYIAAGLAPYDTSSAVNPHSGVFEILSEYGFLAAGFALVAVVLLVRLGAPGFTRSFADPLDAAARQGVLVWAVALPVLSFGDSTYLDSPIAWAGIATTFAFAQYARERGGQPQPRWSIERGTPLPERMRVFARQGPLSAGEGQSRPPRAVRRPLPRWAEASVGRRTRVRGSDPAASETPSALSPGR